MTARNPTTKQVQTTTEKQKKWKKKELCNKKMTVLLIIHNKLETPSHRYPAVSFPVYLCQVSHILLFLFYSI